MPARNGRWYGSRWIRAPRRLAIYARDGHACLWCGAREHLSLDHLWRPVDEVYDNRSSSLVTSCLSCNSRRAGQRLAGWLRYLRRSGADVPAIVAELRRRVRAPVDMNEGRALETSRVAQRARKAAGRAFRATELPALKERTCIPF